MAAPNFQPIWGLTPNVGNATITTTSAQTASNGASAGSSPDLMFKAFTAGAQGSYIDTIRFFSVATGSITGVATVLRAYTSTVASPGATTAANTFLLGELSVGAIASSNSTNATSYYDMPINKAVNSGSFIHVSQHVAQTANQNWIAQVWGLDY